MKEFLYKIMEVVAWAHTKILSLNDAYETNFTDKELHFLVIGVLGLLLVFIIQPIFKWLAENDHVLVITWIYVFTLILVLTFAIEIGQKLTHTGVMEFADIMFGLVGFLVIFLIYPLFRGIIRLILKLIAAIKKK